MAQIVLEIADKEVESIRQKMVEAGILKLDDDVTKPVTVEGEKPIVTISVPVVFFERNELKEECLYVDGDQADRFSGRTVRIEGESYPVIAAVPEGKRTRLIFAVGSALAKLTGEIEVEG